MLLRWSAGQSFVQCLSSKVLQFITYTDSGSMAVFGYLATGALEFENTEMQAEKQMAVLAFKVEAPLCVKPYLNLLTKAEMQSIMTSGFATMSGTVFAAYAAMGANSTHLIVASVLSSPSALAYSKLVYPETEKSKTTSVDIAKLEWTSEQSAVEAILNGIKAGLQIYISILANLICVVTTTKIANILLQSLGSLIGLDMLTFQFLLSYMFSPLALLMGVEWNECTAIGEILGIKTVVNGFVAFVKLITLRENAELSYRSEMIATYALCSFANIVSMGVMLGGLAIVVPTRLSEISSMIVRSLFAGLAASFITACVAGKFILSAF
uniref:Concentrative nucleoside transporter C-terminal domain-containing protein n=1 Tax=Strigamia maritima TaxID=126957 RepID=T1IZU0_STRMM